MPSGFTNKYWNHLLIINLIFGIVGWILSLNFGWEVKLSSSACILIALIMWFVKAKEKKGVC